MSNRMRAELIATAIVLAIALSVINPAKGDELEAQFHGTWKRIDAEETLTFGLDGFVEGTKKLPIIGLHGTDGLYELDGDVLHLTMNKPEDIENLPEWVINNIPFISHPSYSFEGETLVLTEITTGWFGRKQTQVSKWERVPDMLAKSD